MPKKRKVKKVVKRGKIKNKAPQKKRDGKLVNYILMSLVGLGIIWNIIASYYAGTFTTAVFVIAVVLGFFVVYSIYKRMKWVYLFLLFGNLFALIYRMFTIHFAYFFWVEGLWSLAIIIMAYYMLNKKDPKGYPKLPWF